VVKEDTSCLLQGKSITKSIWYIMFLNYNKGFSNKDHQVGYQATSINLIKKFGEGKINKEQMMKLRIILPSLIPLCVRQDK
jgi:hypothetical protein